MSDEWFIQYWWSSEELVPGGYEQLLDDEITEGEYRELFDRNLEQCRVDGLQEISYDLDDFDEDESEGNQKSVRDFPLLAEPVQQKQAPEFTAAKQAGALAGAGMPGKAVIEIV